LPAKAAALDPSEKSLQAKAVALDLGRAKTTVIRPAVPDHCDAPDGSLIDARSNVDACAWHCSPRNFSASLEF
jgi:hypothetical protein